MNITKVQDDSKIWKKNRKNNPEITDLITQIRKWELGMTFEVTLDKPYKSLKAILKREFKGTNKISVMKKDDTNTLWYVKIDTKKVKSSENEMRENAAKN